MSEHVLIIGAGVMGCASAHKLLEAGFKVTLLERALPGAESSAAAAGILGAQSEVASPGPFQDLCLASRALYPDYARALKELSGMDLGYSDAGVLEVAKDPGEGRIAVGRAEWMLDLGQRVELLGPEEARKLEPALSEKIVGANYYPDDHALDPVLLNRALAAAVERLGGIFRIGDQVTGLAVEDGRAVGVETLGETLPADHVVVAAGAWSSRLKGLPQLRTDIKPVAGQMIVADTRPPLFRHVVYGYDGYLAPRVDGRILMGSTLEDRGFDKATTLEGLNRITGMAMRMVPELASARFSQSWSGLRPATGDNLPLLGAGPLAGLYFATGHYRNGILLTPITAQVICSLVQGRDPGSEIGAFAP